MFLIYLINRKQYFFFRFPMISFVFCPKVTVKHHHSLCSPEKNRVGKRRVEYWTNSQRMCLPWSGPQIQRRNLQLGLKWYQFRSLGSGNPWPRELQHPASQKPKLGTLDSSGISVTDSSYLILSQNLPYRK